MIAPPCHVLAVIGSLNSQSVTAVAIRRLAKDLEATGCQVDVVDFLETPLPLFDPDTAFGTPAYAALKERVLKADVFLLGTPDYHGSVSSAMKSFLDHFWKEFAGKLFATVVASHEKGLTVADQLRTIARQCYAWTLPYAVSFQEKTDVENGAIVNDRFADRLRMMAHDIAVYGPLLARQRAVDLAGTDPGFMAKLRS